MFHRRVLPFVIAAAAACSGKESKPNDTTAAKAAASVSPNTITITAQDFAFQAPDTVPAGVTTIKFLNKGPSLHHAQLLRFDQGKTLGDFVAALKAMKPTDQPPTWAVPMGGPNPPDIGAENDVTETLDPGNYAVVCFVDIPDHVPHIMKGMAHAFVVAPSQAAPAAEPTADVTVDLADYTFNLSTPLTAGHHVIRVNNTGPQPHEIFISKLDSGKTMDDVMKFAADYKGKIPVTPLGGVAAMMPGAHAYFTVDVTPGNYVLLCFVADAKDGKPHFMHGMSKMVTVS